MEERTLISEVSGEGKERGEEGDEQEEGGEQPAQGTSISSGSHALSPGAAGLRRNCTGPISGLAQPSVPATNTEAGKKEDSPHISCAQEP